MPARGNGGSADRFRPRKRSGSSSGDPAFPGWSVSPPQGLSPGLTRRPWPAPPLPGCPSSLGSDSPLRRASPLLSPSCLRGSRGSAPFLCSWLLAPLSPGQGSPGSESTTPTWVPRLPPPPLEPGSQLLSGAQNATQGRCCTSHLSPSLPRGVNCTCPGPPRIPVLIWEWSLPSSISPLSDPRCLGQKSREENADQTCIVKKKLFFFKD